MAGSVGSIPASGAQQETGSTTGSDHVAVDISNNHGDQAQPGSETQARMVEAEATPDLVGVGASRPPTRRRLRPQRTGQVLVGAGQQFGSESGQTDDDENALSSSTAVSHAQDTAQTPPTEIDIATDQDAQIPALAPVAIHLDQPAGMEMQMDLLEGGAQFSDDPVLGINLNDFPEDIQWDLDFPEINGPAPP